MTNERILQKILEVKSIIEEATRRQEVALEAFPVIDAIIEEVKKDIAHDTAKQGGKLNQQKAAERVLKSCAKNYRPALQASWIDSDGLQCLCDGFQAFRIKKPLTLPQLPDSLEKLDLKRIVQPNHGKALELPTVATLKTFIKTEKARLKAKKDKSAPAWDFGADLPLVNAEMLLNALEILPGCTATAKNCTSGLYFESPHGCGLVMPLRRA